MTFEAFMQRKRKGSLPRLGRTARYGMPYIAKPSGERKGV